MLSTPRESNEELWSPIADSGSTAQEHFAPKEAGAAPSNTYVLQHNIVSEGCSFGATTANSWQETTVAVENVVNIAEERHQ